ncbi:hypothetical protein [Pontibacterium sp.]|uniref:hypothetical protein n=1 Tax=Pontibacterium sp. TaxID=2036026 RepID=UPI00356478A2
MNIDLNQVVTVNSEPHRLQGSISLTPIESTDDAAGAEKQLRHAIKSALLREFRACDPRIISMSHERDPEIAGTTCIVDLGMSQLTVRWFFRFPLLTGKAVADGQLTAPFQRSIERGIQGLKRKQQKLQLRHS